MKKPVKAVIIIGAAALLLTAGVIAGAEALKDEATPEIVITESTQPTEAPVITEENEADKEELTAVDGNKWTAEYILGIKSQYVKKQGDEEYNKKIDELYDIIDEFYSEIKTGITSAEYEAFENEIREKIQNLTAGEGNVNLQSANQNSSLTMEQLISRAEQFLVEEIEIKILQIEYIDEMSYSEKQRKISLFEEVLEEAEDFLEDMKNGRLTLSESEAKYNEVKANLMEAQAASHSRY